jgi:F0F1-type ATP synthase assembly protein I
MMSREDAIVEEAAMNGVGLKKRHIFPIALGIIFFILLSMFMVWKKLTWFLLIGTNIGLFAHFVYLRRKAKKAGAGGDDGYIKDAGLEIS